MGWICVTVSVKDQVNTMIKTVLKIGTKIDPYVQKWSKSALRPLCRTPPRHEKKKSEKKENK